MSADFFVGNFLIILCIFILPVFPFVTFATQYGSVQKDSIMLIMSDPALSNLQKFSNLNEMTRTYWKISSAKSIQYGRKGLELAESMGNDSCRTEILNSLGVAYYYATSFELALKYFFQALAIASVGIEPNEGGSFIVYPVPNDGNFSLKISCNRVSIFSLKVFNELGIEILQRDDIMVDGTSEIPCDLRPVSPGVYTVVLTTTGQQLKRKIIVK